MPLSTGTTVFTKTAYGLEAAPGSCVEEVASLPADKGEATRHVAPAVPADSHVVVRGVTKRFVTRDRTAADGRAEVTALRDIDLEVRTGEFLSLLGPSGCGKTTLLRMIAGLLPVSEGEIRVGGTRVERPIKQTAMVFQNFGLLPWRSVQRNVEFALELDEVSRAECRRIAGECLALVGLARHGEHYPHELSGGMQQRVGIARALTRRPSLLLMDEPFGALDAQTREELQAEFMRIWAKARTTVVFVTHSIDEALVMSDRIAVFGTQPGRVKAIVDSPFDRRDAAADLRADPAFAPNRARLRELLR